MASTKSVLSLPTASLGVTGVGGEPIGAVVAGGELTAGAAVLVLVLALADGTGDTFADVVLIKWVRLKTFAFTD